MYDAIPDNLPIKYPYPLSSPAPQPPVDVPYARAIPLEVNERLAARHNNKHSDPEPSLSNTEAGSSLSPALQQQKDPLSATLASKEKGKERERSPLPPSPAVVILHFPNHPYQLCRRLLFRMASRHTFALVI